MYMPTVSLAVPFMHNRQSLKHIYIILCPSDVGMQMVTERLLWCPAVDIPCAVGEEHADHIGEGP